MRIRFVKAEETWALRREVLRPGQPHADVDWPRDHDEDSFHLAAYSGEQLIAVASFYREKHPELQGWIQYRLRGMATISSYQGKGIGRRMLYFALDHLRAKKADLLWANARVTALPFYTKLGFGTHGPEFMIEGIGPHFVVFQRL